MILSCSLLHKIVDGHSRSGRGFFLVLLDKKAHFITIFTWLRLFASCSCPITRPLVLVKTDVSLRSLSTHGQVTRYGVHCPASLVTKDEGHLDGIIWLHLRSFFTSFHVASRRGFQIHGETHLYYRNIQTRE